jgi:hypothetical protein
MPENFGEAQIKELLVSAGYRLQDDGRAWRTSALYRGGKNPMSLLVYKNSGVWHDYGAGLSSQPFGKLLELSGVNADGLPKPDANATPIVKQVEESQSETVFPESVLSKLFPHYKFYLERGIPQDVLRRLKGGLAMSGKMYQRFVFPIYNKNSQISGFSGRYIGSNIEGKPNKPKWKHFGKKINWVYPLYVKDEKDKHFVRDAILRTKEIILVESIGDMLAFHSRGIFNVLVCFGLKIGTALMCALVELDPDKIFLALNDDSQKEKGNNGRIAAIKNFLMLLSYFDYSSIGLALPLKNDFGEMNDVDFEKWLEIKSQTDYNEQRMHLCEEIQVLKESKTLREEHLKNLRILDCG